MAGIDASIPLGIKVPDTMHTIGSILDIQTKRQALDTNAIQQQRAGVQLQQEQGDLTARKAVAAVISNPEFRDPETGAFDLNRGAAAIVQADPDNYHATKAIEALAKNNTDIINVKKNALSLVEGSRNLLGSTVGALSNDPNASKAGFLSALDSLAAQAPDAKPTIAIWKRHIGALPDDPKALNAYAIQARNQVMPPDTQRGAMTPSGPVLNNGQQQQQYNTNPGAGATGPVPGVAVQNVVSPAQKDEIVKDAAGNSFRSVRGPDGTVTIHPLEVSQPGPGRGTMAQMTLPPGESPQSAQLLTGVRNEVNQAASKVPEQHFNNQQILKLADVSLAGTGGQQWAKVFSANGLQWVPGDETANTQQLGHFMSLQAQANAKAMGAGTDAARSLSEQATGSTAWTPDAIKRATKINDALSTGVDLFNRGMEAAINKPGNQNGIFAAREFQNAWSRTFDVNAMRLHNAIQSGDTTEQKAIVESVGGKNSAGAKVLATKMRALDALISAGGP